MNSGMLWMDTVPNKSLEEKVLGAANYYQKKYKQVPNLCLTHPASCSGTVNVSGIRVEADRSILPHHFWIGVDGGNGN